MKRPDYKCMAIAEWVCVYAIEHGGNSPSLQEIADYFEISVVTVWHHVERLQEFGMAERKDGKLVLSGAGYLPPVWYAEKILA